MSDGHNLLMPVTTAIEGYNLQVVGAIYASIILSITSYFRLAASSSGMFIKNVKSLKKKLLLPKSIYRTSMRLIELIKAANYSPLLHN